MLADGMVAARSAVGCAVATARSGPADSRVLSLALGLCWMILLLLFIHWWPGPIELWPMITVYARARWR